MLADDGNAFAGFPWADRGHGPNATVGSQGQASGFAYCGMGGRARRAVDIPSSFDGGSCSGGVDLLGR